MVISNGGLTPGHVLVTRKEVLERDAEGHIKDVREISELITRAAAVQREKGEDAAKLLLPWINAVREAATKAAWKAGFDDGERHATAVMRKAIPKVVAGARTQHGSPLPPPHDDELATDYLASLADALARYKASHPDAAACWVMP